MKIVLLLLGTAVLSLEQTSTPHIAAAAGAYEAGQAAAHSKHYETAIDLFEKAIQIEPTFQEAYSGLIDANLDLGRRSEAAVIITQLLEIDSEANRYRLLLAKILAEQNQTGRALAQFSLVLKTDPGNADALLGFAAAAKKLGMDDRAADALERGRKQHPLDKRFSAKQVQ